ncbi:multicopper oxidase family protein [Waterburya agarophytonicola K14]|uniref:Multicopper oxidase family protein n=1 Tax=Waterburya agarophytonicola KI4 TaxID=2874699 RepID=A0A964BTP6_9CYAN|nr:multicopper oxidase family protein [Waterburya agarophytonicola]MCC0178328.1 multicopper oxidase family protein [Waterburya agarophytonicola KI4]
MVKLNRRQFIALGTASMGTALVGNWLYQEKKSSQPKPLSSANLTPVYQSSNGLLELDLEARESLVNLGGQQASLLTYNGQIPAPRLEAKPGDTVRIHFTNNLEQPTNIHYHGLHIPLVGNADNVFLKIEPGKQLTYEFQIASNHPSGTFWYHPHLHGLVAEQLFGGLAGMFIVRGELDEIPELKAAQEEFLVLQDFSLDNRGKRADSAHMSLMMGREGDIIAVNGQANPSINLLKGGLLRLRILNASPSRFYRLALEDSAFYQIATDGNSFSEPIEVNELLLTPGQRTDVLVKASQESGQYRLLNLPYDRGSIGMMGGGMMGRRNNSDTPIVLAKINYKSTVESLTLPTKLAPIEPLPEPQTVRRFELNHGMNPAVGMAFLINGEPYDRDRLHTQVQLNTIEDWELINIGVMDHPFHIHGNAFQVISRNGIPELLLAWRDTVLVKRGERVRIRMPFRDFAGKTVYHCHVLDHEDLGMMGNLMISA